MDTEKEGYSGFGLLQVRDYGFYCDHRKGERLPAVRFRHDESDEGEGTDVTGAD